MEKFPLSWPAGWPRTPAHDRKRARFGKDTRVQSQVRPDYSYRRRGDLSIDQATARVLKELRTFGVLDGDAIISTNLELRLDGLPRSGQRAPSDPGVAVYWQRPDDKSTKVMAIDLYDRVADNLAAIAATLDAMRAIERHGGARILERAFTGFTALPAPNQKREWWDVLGVSRSCTREEVKQAYRRLSSIHHPDKPGGSHEAMTALNVAQDEGLEACTK